MRRDWWRCFWTYSTSPVLLSCGMGLYWNKNWLQILKVPSMLETSLKCWWQVWNVGDWFFTNCKKSPTKSKSHQHNDFTNITVTAYIFRSWSGIGLFKNLQSGSHPSFKSHTKRFSFGTVAITWLLCWNQFYCAHFWASRWLFTNREPGNLSIILPEAKLIWKNCLFVIFNRPKRFC